MTSGIDWDEIGDASHPHDCDCGCRSKPSSNAGDGLQVLLDAFMRWKDKPPASVELPRRTWWIVLGALQLATRHPDAPLKEDVESAAREIQRVICDTAEVLVLAELGWNPEHDVYGRGEGT